MLEGNFQREMPLRNTISALGPRHGNYTTISALGPSRGGRNFSLPGPRGPLLSSNRTRH